jgi:hypothetical protein
MAQTKIITKKEKGANRHWKNFVDKAYLGAHNLEAGEEMLVTIAKFEGEEIVESKENGKQPKPVLYFVEKVPKLIMNMTNGNTLSQLYGTHPEGWIGKQIQLYAASVKAFGKTQDAIRIRDFVPKIAVDVASFTLRIDGAKTLAELVAVWKSFPQSAQKDPEVFKAKEARKAALSVPNTTA